MLIGIDHLVIIVPDLDLAMRQYGELGFSVLRGGKHPWGSENALIPFADGAYLELVAFGEPEVEHIWRTRLEGKSGLADFCAQTDDLPGDVAAFRRAGVDMGDPVAGSRKRPDGYELRWVTSLAAPPGYLGKLPFLIQDETPRAERVSGQTNHPNGVTGIGALTLAVGDAASVGGWYAGVLGGGGQAITRSGVGGSGLRFALGPHALEVLTPDDPDGPLHHWMEEYGPSLFSATLLTDSADKAPLDLRLTSGAQLFLG